MFALYAKATTYCHVRVRPSPCSPKCSVSPAIRTFGKDLNGLTKNIAEYAPDKIFECFPAKYVQIKQLSHDNSYWLSSHMMTMGRF